MKKWILFLFILIRIFCSEHETDCVIYNVIQIYNTIYYIQIKFKNTLKLRTIVGYMHIHR